MCICARVSTCICHRKFVSERSGGKIAIVCRYVEQNGWICVSVLQFQLAFVIGNV